jgi:PAS domain S-box-containing protein
MGRTVARVDTSTSEQPRDGLLTAAGAVLDASLDYEATLSTLAALVVEHMAGWCAIHMADDREGARAVAVAHNDPEMVELARRLQAEYPPDRDAPTGAPNVIRTGQAELYTEITDELLRAGARDEAHLALMRSLNLRSALVVPLSARGRTLGALTMIAEGARRFDEYDLDLARELGRRAGMAVDNAQLYQSATAGEQRSEEARAILDTLIEDAPVGFGYFDDQLRYVRVNRALADIHGVPAAEHIGRRVPDVLPGIGVAKEAALREVLVSGEPVIETIISGTTPVGGDRHLQLSCYRIPIPGGAGAIGVGATVVDLTERVRAQDAMRAQRDLYETLLRAQSDLGEGFVLIEGERILFVNEAAEQIGARSAQELYALQSFYDLVPVDQQAAVGAIVEELVTGGRPNAAFETAILSPAGGRIDIEVGAKSLVVDGRPRLVVLIRDIAERKRQEAERTRLLAAERQARRETEIAHARASLIAEVSAILERSMVLHDTLREVAVVLAARVCEVVSIHVLSRDGATLERVGLAARDPERDALYATIRGTTLDTDRNHPLAGVALTGRPRSYEDLSDGEMRETADTPGVLEILKRVAGRSGVALPLTARGHPVGVLGVGWDEAGHVPDGEELAHFVEIGRRLGLAIDNAQLYAERAHIASTLQAGLLPTGLPAIPGVEMAARYLPAGEASEVGGDFYDAFALGEREWSVVIGDVCGKGPEAAAVTAMARYTLRAKAVAGATGPADALALLNRAALSESTRFLSAVVCDLRLAGDGAVEAAIACAGHPAPLVLRGGVAEALTVGGPLVGIDHTAEWHQATVHLAPGDGLILYTDGVTEARRSYPLSAERLGGELLLPGPSASAEALADAVREVAESRAPGGRLRDDVAIVALRLPQP